MIGFNRFSKWVTPGIKEVNAICYDLAGHLLHIRRYVTTLRLSTTLLWKVVGAARCATISLTAGDARTAPEPMEPFKYINPDDHPLCTLREEEYDCGLTYYFENEDDQNCCFNENEMEKMMIEFDNAGIPYVLTAMVPFEDEYDDYNINNHPSLSAAERNPTLR